MSGKVHVGGKQTPLIVEDAKNLWPFLIYHRYLGINPTKRVQGLYTGNNESLLREILKDLNS